jgi:hypothetical protein
MENTQDVNAASGSLDRLVSWLAERFDRMSLITKASAWLSFNLMALKGLIWVIAWLAGGKAS